MVIDYKKLLEKYMLEILAEESIDYVHLCTAPEFSTEEIEALENISAKIQD